MKAKILAAFASLTVLVLLLTALSAVFSRANEDLRYAMSEDSYHEHSEMHEMTEREHDQCETMYEEHHNATVHEESHNESSTHGCH